MGTNCSKIVEGQGGNHKGRQKDLMLQPDFEGLLWLRLSQRGIAREQNTITGASIQA
jgi:hypothetical protein